MAHALGGLWTRTNAADHGGKLVGMRAVVDDRIGKDSDGRIATSAILDECFRSILEQRPELKPQARRRSNSQRDRVKTSAQAHGPTAHPNPTP